MMDVAQRAGDMAADRSPAAGQSPEVWEKSPGDPVSEVDLAVNVMLQARLMELRPKAGWLSEETADDPARLACSEIWCVDPIDGTRDYVRGRPGWCVSIALIREGAPQLGVLYAPARQELWQAKRGSGAFCNGVHLRASARENFAGARVPTDSLPSVDSDLTMVEKPNSIALRMAMVADDRADLVATLRWGFEWDVAAAALIVAEAGGMVSDAHGGPLLFNTQTAQAFGVLACSPAIHLAVVARLSDRAAKLSAR
jgi:myo-inositol-1(or 4)-monophosphatase